MVNTWSGGALLQETRSESDFQRIAEAMPQLVWTATPEGTIEYFNRRWIEYTGLDVAHAGAVERFALLKYGLALVLVFVGLKMVWLNDAFGGKFPIGWSLGIIGSVIALSIVGSIWATRNATKNTLCKENKEDEVVVENRNTGWN